MIFSVNGDPFSKELEKGFTFKDNHIKTIFWPKIKDLPYFIFYLKDSIDEIEKFKEVEWIQLSI